VNGFPPRRSVLPLLVIGCCTVVGGAVDDPPFDPTSPEDVAERQQEQDSADPDLSGPSVAPQEGRRGGGVPGSPGAPSEPGMREGGGGAMNVLNVLTTHCERCHGAVRQRGGLQILPLDQLFTGSQDYWVVRRGAPHESELYRRITLESDHEDVMPPDGEPMTKAEIELVANWIRSGAPTNVQPVRRQRSVRPRQWFQLYTQLELDPGQRTKAREILTSFETDNRSFEREHRDRINALRRIAQSSVSEMRSQEEIDRAKSELDRLNAMKRKAEDIQSTLWAALSSQQQEALRQLLAAAESQPRAGGRSNRRAPRTREQPSTLSSDEQRRLRDLMRRGGGNQGDDDED